MPSLFVSNKLRTASTIEQDLVKRYVITAVYNYDR